MKNIRIEKAGCADYNGLNCRMRTALKNKDGKEYYIEFGAAHIYNAKNKEVLRNWLFIDFLFRIDIKEDAERSYTKELYEIVKTINGRKLDYTESNILYLLSLIGIADVNIIYCDNYKLKEYTPHKGNYEGYNFGNA